MANAEPRLTNLKILGAERNDGKLNTASLFLLSFFHPIEGLDILKRERFTLKWRHLLWLYGAAVLARLFYVLVVHYPLQDTSIKDANLLLELVKLLGPVLSWAISSYMITSILEGETTLKEILISTAYSFIPYIVFTPMLALVSHLLSANDAGLFAAFQGAVIAWMVLFLLIAFQRLNSYNFGRTVGVGLLSLIFMVLLWALLLLFAALSVQAFYFFETIFKEISLKYLA